MLGFRKDREIRDRITRNMDLWERGLHTDLVGYAEAEGAAREGRLAREGEEEEDVPSKKFHRMVL